MDDVKISAVDQERIDDLVAQFRIRITNLYTMAYLQGAIHEAEEARKQLRARTA